MRCLLRTEDLLEVLHADNSTLLRERTLHLCQRLGYEFFVYGQQKPDQLLIHSTFPISWQRLYTERGLMQIDPTVRHVRQSCLPLIWAPETFTGNGGQQLRDAARSYGIRSGVSLSLRDSDGSLAMFSLASDIPMGDIRDAHSRQTLPEALLLTSYFKEAAQRLAIAPTAMPTTGAWAIAQTPALSTASGAISTQAQPPSGASAATPSTPLTSREVECLQWTMAGKTSWETGRIIGCSERTVNFHIGNAIRKLEVKNRRCAVVKALALNLIQF